jgi:mono/diheme cytochrome c family protein
MNLIRILLAGLSCAAAAGATQAQDVDRGRELYGLHCIACHYERIHERDAAKSLVRSRDELDAEVARRARLVQHRLAAEDLSDIAAYLDRTHYRFDNRRP